MIDKLSIKNIKSIKTLSIDCKRIILLIGERISGNSITIGSPRSFMPDKLPEVVNYEKNPV
ncbi:MAG: hypothetical protein MPEBLZ_03370 [Candidatus Methanoperedens nitroreducens]|uniref:Uncharacterized protein n=1 Tax=Candidatus Methanoperedens nitratireducens TaxID=1392998 RepID=A0A0P7ZBU7_9EURY|nr:MAG: hypothetical protein MPEBLZ_03370 [Candidatus Methanoperedens sp. BLZ1]